MENRKAFLLKRSGAWLVTIIIIIAFSLFAVNMSLGARMNNVSDLFYEGVNGNKAIADLLKERCDASLVLIKASERISAVSEGAQTLDSARAELLAMLREKASPSALYDANTRLDDAFSDLYSGLTAHSLTAGETADIKAAQKRMANAADAINSAGYNEVAGDFDDDFFTNFLMKICLAKRPEPFK